MRFSLRVFWAYLSIGLVKYHTLLGQIINIGSDSSPISIATESRSEVIWDNHKDINATTNARKTSVNNTKNALSEHIVRWW